MAFMKIGTRYIKNREEWVEDFEAAYESDIQALPKANPGSTCHVLETNRTVEMAYNGVWGGGSGGGGVTSWNDLTDKPFYTEEAVAIEIVPETTVTFSEDGEGMLPAAPSLAVGTEYTVKWNGTEYKCTAQNAVTDGVQMGVAIGDFGLVSGGTSTGEPFIIIAIDPSMVATIGATNMCMALDGSTSATVSIYGGTGDIVHKLDNKYLDLDWTPNPIGETVIGAEKTLETGDKFPDLTIDMVHEGMKVVIYSDGIKYELSVIISDGIVVTDNYASILLGRPAIPVGLQFNSNGTTVFFADDKTHVVSVCKYVYDALLAEHIPDTVLKVSGQTLDSTTQKLVRENIGVPGCSVTSFVVAETGWTQREDGKFVAVVPTPSTFMIGRIVTPYSDYAELFYDNNVHFGKSGWYENGGYVAKTELISDAAVKISASILDFFK